MVTYLDINYFYLDVKDPRFFTLLDYSDWANHTNSEVFVEFIMPGGQEVILCWDKNAINRYDSTHLLCPCSDCNCDEKEPLPDGIYQIKVFVDGDDCAFFEKTVVRTTQIELDVYKALTKSYIDCGTDNDSLVKYYNDIRGQILMSNANAAFDNTKQASEHLERAVGMLKSLDCG